VREVIHATSYTAETKLNEKLISPRHFKVQAQSLFSDQMEINFRYPLPKNLSFRVVQILIRATRMLIKSEYLSRGSRVCVIVRNRN
jgi:hypothetical protein